MFNRQIGFRTHSVCQCKFDGVCDGDGDGDGLRKWTLKSTIGQVFQHNFTGSNKPSYIHYRFYQDWNHFSALAVIKGWPVEVRMLYYLTPAFSECERCGILTDLEILIDSLKIIPK